MRRAIRGAALAVVLLGGCAGLRDLVNPYPDAKFDCEEIDCTRCVPIEGAPHPRGYLCGVNRDRDPSQGRQLQGTISLDLPIPALSPSE